MAKKQLISFRIPENTPAFGGLIHYQNPRYFSEQESIPAYATHFVADEEHIRQAYLKAGVEEYGVQKRKEKEEVVEVSNVETEVEVSDLEDKDDEKSVEDMSWPELRSYAASLTDETIKNKEVALRVIAEKG